MINKADVLKNTIKNFSFETREETHLANKVKSCNAWTKRSKAEQIAKIERATGFRKKIAADKKAELVKNLSDIVNEKAMILAEDTTLENFNELAEAVRILQAAKN